MALVSAPFPLISERCLAGAQGARERNRVLFKEPRNFSDLFKHVQQEKDCQTPVAGRP
jgi:hypothetical protein